MTEDQKKKLEQKLWNIAKRRLKHTHHCRSTALKKAVKLNIKQSNPCENVTAPKPLKKKAPMLNKEQASHFLATAKDSKYFPQILLALLTGMRLGEIMGLSWKNIDLDKGYANIWQTVQRVNKLVFIKERTKSHSSFRTMELPQLAIDLLRKQKIAQKEQRLKMAEVYIPRSWLSISHIRRLSAST